MSLEVIVKNSELRRDLMKELNEYFMDGFKDKILLDKLGLFKLIYIKLNDWEDRFWLRFKESNNHSGLMTRLDREELFKKLKKGRYVVKSQGCFCNSESDEKIDVLKLKKNNLPDTIINVETDDYSYFDFFMELQEKGYWICGSCWVFEGCEIQKYRRKNDRNYVYYKVELFFGS